MNCRGIDAPPATHYINSDVPYLYSTLGGLHPALSAAPQTRIGTPPYCVKSLRSSYTGLYPQTPVPVLIVRGSREGISPRALHQLGRPLPVFHARGPAPSAVRRPPDPHR